MLINRAVLGVILPPVAVYIERGSGKDLSINIVLLIFTMYIGAIIHAFHLMGIALSTNLLCLFLPPIAAALEGSLLEFFICLILTFFCFVPGVIYAYFVALKYNNKEYQE